MPNLKKRTKINCTNCKNPFSINNGELKNRLKKNKSGNLYCSKKCMDEYRRKQKDGG